MSRLETDELVTKKHLTQFLKSFTSQQTVFRCLRRLVLLILQLGGRFNGKNRNKLKELDWASKTNSFKYKNWFSTNKLLLRRQINTRDLEVTENQNTYLGKSAFCKPKCNYHHLHPIFESQWLKIFQMKYQMGIEQS